MRETMTARIWLRMLAEGGRWSAAEAGAIVGLDRARADSILWLLAKRGYIAPYRGTERKNSRTYGVHAGCRVPEGVALQDIMAATESGAAANDNTRRAA